MEEKRKIFDAHLDLAMNALEWNRDLTLSVQELRDREAGMEDKPDRERGTVSLPAMQEGNIGLCVATQIARYVKKSSNLPGWQSPEQAWAQTQGQLAWYRAMEAKGMMRQVLDIATLDHHLSSWENNPVDGPLGYVLSLEGADSIVDLSYVEKAYEQGLRAIGPAHYGPGTYAFGTGSVGGMNSKGKALLKEMERLNIILDATHLSDECFDDAMDYFNGHVWASHSNCRDLVPDQRQFSNEQIQELIGRGAVIGAVFDAWMLVPNWERGVSTPKGRGVTLNVVIDNIDHICQLAGNALHVGIGSDLDGAFGTEQSPHDLDTIANLQLLPDLLSQRGYAEEDIDNILFNNWVRFLRKAWS